LQTLIDRLDLAGHLSQLSNFFAREKPFILEGDIQLHHAFITELEPLELPPIPTVANLDGALMRLHKLGTLKLDELYDLVRMGRFFMRLKERIFEGRMGRWLLEIEIPPAVEGVMAAFDEKGRLDEQAAPELARVNRAIEAKRREIKAQMGQLTATKGLGEYLVDRQVHLVSGEETLLLRGGFHHVLSGRVIDRTPAGFFYVLPKAIADRRDQLDRLESEAQEQIALMERKLSEKLHNQVRFLRFLNGAFDRYDHYQARLAFAKATDMAIMAPQGRKRVTLSGFAHPALHDAVPVSLALNHPVMLITGVNAGGKTMLLKALLSAVFMARYLIPMRINAAKSEIGRFKGIEAIISDPQSARNDISTFAGRMEQFVPLFSQNDQLLGVDEIELGTDSDEAASLFRVMIEALIERGHTVVATTHHKRLAALMASDDRVELIAALYDEARQRPTFGFLQGSIGRSYAFETAARYGIPAAVISQAKSSYGADRERLNDLIERSSELERTLQAQIHENEAQSARLARRNEALKEARHQLEEQYRELRSQLEREYKTAIDKAKAAQRAKNEPELHRALNEAHSAKKQISTPPKPAKPDKTETIAVGDAVRYAGAIGTVKSIKKQNAVIECEGKTLYAPLFLLKKAPKAAAKKPPPKSQVHIQKSASARVKLDLHGLRVHEALDELDRFLSDALMAGFEEVMVYHGIGSGRLARAVREALSEHPRVQGYSDAPANQGGFGATIVQF
jgi:DNA mismatch repair protein MutS2